jgi:hypothetical protein
MRVNKSRPALPGFYRIYDDINLKIFAHMRAE